MVSTSEGDTATDTVWSAVASAAGGEASSSGIRVPSSSATARTIARLEFGCLQTDELQEMAEFFNWVWNLTQRDCELSGARAEEG